MDLYNNFNDTELFLNDDLISKVGVMASKIAYHNFAWRYITLLMYSSAQVIGLQPFLLNYNRTVVINTGSSVRPRRRNTITQFVIFGEHSSEVSNMITWLINSKCNSTAKFVIICASPFQECDERNIFRTLAKLSIVNVVVLKLSSESNEPLAYTYLIMLPGKCLNADPERIVLTTNCKNDACFKTIYPEKLSNFHGCPFIVSTIEQPPYMFLHNGTREPSGKDGDIVSFVASVLNASLVLRTPLDGWGVGTYDNNNWTGSFGDLYNQRADASVCSTPLTATTYGNFQISFSFNSMDIIWVARLPLPKPPWEKILRPLNFQVWITLLFMFIGITFLDILRKTRMWNEVIKVFQIGASKRSLLLYSWMIFLGLPILQISRKRGFLIMVYIWIWICFIMRNAYQAALFTSLKQTAYHDNFEDFNEVLQSGYHYGGPVNLREYYSQDLDIYKNWINLEFKELLDTLDSVSSASSSFVMAASKDIINYYLEQNDNDKKRFQIIPEKIVNSPTVIYFKKYSAMTNPVSRILRIASESGIVERVYRRYRRDVTPRRDDDTVKPLSLIHFAGGFAILFLGYLMSTIYFVVEIIWGNLENE